jgi:tRNA G18 (ribose-2'-O)-methylase SpoU
MTNFFSKQKFMTLSLERRHKKAAHALKKLYENLLKGSIPPACVAEYRALESYLNLSTVDLSFEALSNRFHEHAKISFLSFKEHHLLPRVTTQDLPSNESFLPIDIFLDNIRSAHNIGSIVRTTEALRLGSLFFSQAMAFTSCKKLQDTAMGTLEKVNIQLTSDLADLKKPLIAIETAKDAISLYDFIFPTSFSLLLGNEEYGLSQKSLSQADYIIKIPLHGFKNSLNVACTFSMIGNEIRRQLAYNKHI